MHILCIDAHEGGKYFFKLRSKKHTKSKMAACLRRNSRWPLFFRKLYMSLPIHRSIDLSNPLRIYRDSIFFKDICNSRGNAPLLKIQWGDCSATLPYRSGRYQGTTLTTWLNFYTPCKSQLQNAWPVSPTTEGSFLKHYEYVFTPKNLKCC